MESTPGTDGDPGTPPPSGPPQPPAAPPDQGRPYGGPPYQGPPPQGQPYPGPPPQGQPYQGAPPQGQPYQGAPPQYPGMPPMRPVDGTPGGPQQWQPRTTSVPAVLALIFSIVGGILVSVILAIVALSRISSRNQKGKGLAIAALVISGVWVVGLVVFASVVGDGEPDRDASGQVTTTANARPDKLRVGDCVSEIKEGDVANVKVVPCSGPNGGSVFAVFELPAGDWPGLAAVQAAAEKGCVDRAKALKPQPAEDSGILYLHPIEDGWSRGDRGTTCLLTPN